MRIPSFAQLSSFIRRVLGFHMPSPFDDVFDSRFSDLPQEVYPVLSVYIRARGNEISDPDGTHSDTPSPRIRDVWLKKCLPSVAEHEYLVVAIVSGKRPWADDDVIGHLKIERAYDPMHGNAFLAASVDSSNTSSATSTSGISHLPAKFNQAPIPARDTITFDPPNADTTVFSHTFDEASAPSLLDLLVAANTLNVHSPHYILFERQCYWFAGMLLRVLLGDIDADPEVIPGPAQTASFSPAYKQPEDSQDVAQPVLAGRAGTFKNLFEIVTRKKIDLLYNSEIKQAYQSKRAEVVELVEHAARKAKAARAREEALQETARKREEALEEAARKREGALEEAARKREEALEEAARKREEALQEEMARMREELSRLKVAATESHGAPPHAQ